MGIIYEKELITPRLDAQRLQLTPADWNTGQKKGVLSPAVCENALFAAGTLHPAFAPATVSGTLSAVPLLMCRWQDALYCYCTGGALFRVANGTVSATGLTFGQVCAMVPWQKTDGTNELLILGSNSAALSAGGATRMLSGVSASAGAVHYERLFLVEASRKDRLWFSEALEPAGWARATLKSGYLDLPSPYGQIARCISFGERLYLFRRYGVTELRAFGDSRNFKAVDQKLPCGEIYADSVAHCGDCLVFLSETGLYRYDGNRCERIAEGLFPLFKGVRQSGVQGGYAQGVYGVCVKRKDGSKALLCADVREGTGVFVPANVKALCGGDALYGYTDALITLSGTGSYVWDSGLQTWNGSGERRRLRELRVFGRGQVTVTVYTASRTCCETLNAEGCARMALQLSGRAFGIKLEGTAALSGLEVLYDI